MAGSETLLNDVPNHFSAMVELAASMISYDDKLSQDSKRALNSLGCQLPDTSIGRQWPLLTSSMYSSRLSARILSAAVRSVDSPWESSAIFDGSCIEENTYSRDGLETVYGRQGRKKFGLDMIAWSGQMARLGWGLLVEMSFDNRHHIGVEESISTKVLVFPDIPPIRQQFENTIASTQDKTDYAPQRYGWCSDRVIAGGDRAVTRALQLQTER